MKKFKDLRENVLQYFFLSEEAKRPNLSGSINDPKSLRHVKNYVAPYLSKTQKATTEKAFTGHMAPGSLGTEHGTHHNPEAHTHVLATAHGEHAVGTPVQVTGAHHDKGIIHVTTKAHGTFPMSKLEKPKELAKPAVTKTGFDVEGKIAKNLGSKSAGSTKHAYDFSYKGDHTKGVRGKIKEVGAPESKPVVRGESKLERGKMGEATIKHTPEKGWHLSERGNKEVGAHLQKAVHPQSGLGVLEHLNKHHPEGKIEKNVQFNAAPGTAQHYLKHSNANVLHIHNKVTDKGTSFTIGEKNDLKGVTKLGHLSHAALEKFNGKIQVKPTTTGTSTMVHRPVESVMRSHANLSAEHPEKHRDLTSPAHAKEFKQHVDTHLGKA
jgi:hypothetical protein